MFFFDRYYLEFQKHIYRGKKKHLSILISVMCNPRIIPDSLFQLRFGHYKTTTRASHTHCMA